MDVERHVTALAAAMRQRAFCYVFDGRPENFWVVRACTFDDHARCLHLSISPLALAPGAPSNAREPVRGIELPLILVTNHKPRIAGTDHALWRRVVLVPFAVTIPEADQDKTLGDKLLAELPGILAWAVLGCLEWQRHGLAAPPAVVAATEDYRQDMDQIGAFLRERCDLSKAYATVPTGELYRIYQEWANVSGEDAVSKKLFGMRLADRGITQSRNGRIRFHRGIRLREPVTHGDASLVTDGDATSGSPGVNFGGSRETNRNSRHHASPSHPDDPLTTFDFGASEGASKPDAEDDWDRGEA